MELKVKVRESQRDQFFIHLVQRSHSSNSIKSGLCYSFRSLTWVAGAQVVSQSSLDPGQIDRAASETTSRQTPTLRYGVQFPSNGSTHCTTMLIANFSLLLDIPSSCFLCVNSYCLSDGLQVPSVDYRSRPVAALRPPACGHLICEVSPHLFVQLHSLPPFPHSPNVFKVRALHYFTPV